jgi:DNA-binding MarR family transcriptional regulator
MQKPAPDSPSQLQIELRQGRPFRSAAQECVLSLLRTASVIRRSLSRVVEAYGISVAQYNVLRILRGAGHDGLPTLAIRDRLIEEAPGITRLVDKLDAAGLVSRARVGTDRRQVVCCITPKGLELLEQLDPVVDRSDVAAVGGLSEEDLRALITLLEQVRALHTDTRELGALCQATRAAEAAEAE